MARIILYRNGAHSDFSAEVDDDDFQRASSVRWALFIPNGSKTMYARCGINGATVYLHRFILGAEKGQEIDHIDGDGLNNRRENLRFVTHKENIRSAFRLPGRYGVPTIDELDAELASFEEWQEREANSL